MKRLVGNASVYVCNALDHIPARWEGHWHLHGQWGCRFHVCRPWALWGD